MQTLRESSLDEYARSFWQRESQKNAAGAHIWKLIQFEGGDAVQLLGRSQHEGGHPYKLPSRDSNVVRVVLLETIGEIGSLLIHKGMSQDAWMQQRRLAPATELRRLDDLAAVFVTNQYFERPDADGTQVKCYRRWKANAILDGALGDQSLPLIESVATDETEIIDGWGRLLPYLVLLNEGFKFLPVKCFLASRD